ncbi:MAG: HK97 family phage prohead protease [Sphingomonadales bacterium]|nr:HK97 family phage prohead protease [Sphingomonadales bacterium]
MNFLDTTLTINSLDDAGVFHGIASDWTMNRNGWQYEAGAFAASLAAHKQRGTMPAMLLYHDDSRPAGRWESIEIKADAMHVKGRVARQTQNGAEAYELMKVGALQALSTGCRHIKQRAAADRSGVIISEADLCEISLVSVPGNANTRIIRVNSIGGAREIENMLREAGISGRKAKAAAAAAWRAIDTTPEPDAASITQILSAATASLSRFHRSDK